MEKRQELLMSYIRANVAPILVDFISGKDVKGAVVIPANIDNKELIVNKAVSLAKNKPKIKVKKN